MKIGIVVAVDNHNGIGLGGVMPWKSRADMQSFSAITRTMGGNMLMGRRTWESIGCRPLAGRTSYVVSSHDPGNGAVWLRSPDDISVDFVWAVGGSAIYDWALARGPDIAFVTEMDGVFGCDTFFGGLRGNYERELAGRFEQDAKNSCAGQIWRCVPAK